MIGLPSDASLTQLAPKFCFRVFGTVFRVQIPVREALLEGLGAKLMRGESLCCCGTAAVSLE